MLDEYTETETAEAKKILEQLSMENIAFAMSQLAIKLISGQKVEEETYNVKVSIPKELADVFKQLADAAKAPIENLLSEFARKGFNQAVQNKMAETKGEQPVLKQKQDIPDLEQLMPKLGPGLLEGLEKIQQLAEKLGEMQKVVEDVHVPEAPENSSKSNISSGTVPESTAVKP